MSVVNSYNLIVDTERCLSEDSRGDNVYLPLGQTPITCGSDEFIRSMRDAKLAASDGKIAPDMPEALKQQWLDYRQKLRDLPADWADVPNYLVRFPQSPEDGPNMEFAENINVIRIADRDASDADALSNLPPGVY